MNSTLKKVAEINFSADAASVSSASGKMSARVYKILTPNVRKTLKSPSTAVR
jgi:hypothetical protein